MGKEIDTPSGAIVNEALKINKGSVIDVDGEIFEITDLSVSYRKNYVLPNVIDIQGHWFEEK